MKTLSRLLMVCLTLALGLPALALADDGGYGYFRMVEGSATVTPAGTDEGSPAEVNQPILAGDRLSVSGSRSRVEVILADQNILRVDGRSELVFERLAASPDRDDRATVLRLLGGNVQLIVTQESLGDELPRIETPNASVYPQDYGSYRVTSDQGWTQIVVRRGTAQVVTDGASSRVRADEEAVIDDQDPDRRPSIREAGAFDSLERWGRQLDDEYASADLGDYVDDNLRYQAAPLARYGAWITINGGHYWRPRVDASWRPYWQGRWVYTPAGLTWIASEPWGWIPYHYGTWDYAPGYGWVWQPGYVWSPAWVYWYWGTNYVGWCPTGYYTHYYGPELGVDVSFRWGVYGWAGGSWNLFDRWSFVSTSYFDYAAGYRQGYRDGYWDAHRDVRRYAVPIDRHGHRPPERGIITTDTKPLRPSVFRDPSEPLRVLRGHAHGDLQDVTPFVARTPKPKLPPAVIRSVVAEKPQVLDGTPLRPGTLGKPDRRPPGERNRSIFGAAPGERKPAVVQPAPGEPQQVRPGHRPAPQADGGAPRPRPGKPAVEQPTVQGGQPTTERERPGRRPAAPEVQGGAPAPKPERQPVERERPSVFGGKPDRTEPPQQQPQTEERRRPPENRQPAEERKPPADRERSVRPAPEVGGGAPAPRPERQPAVVEPRPERQPQVQERRQPEPRPQVQERRPPERQPEVQERRPPERQPEVRREERREEKRKPEEDKKPPR